MIEEEIRSVFEKDPDVLYGFADICYSEYKKDYASALIIAVPLPMQLTMDDYSEELFDEDLITARSRMDRLVASVEEILQNHDVKYWVPPLAQTNETELRALFSFKTAATHAGIGWFGKNDVIITEQYGPRIRLAAVLIDAPFNYGERITESRCPDDCMKCVEACPCKAIKGEQWSAGVTRDKLIDYHKCNKMRSAFIPKLGRKNACGLCFAACPFGTKRQG